MQYELTFLQTSGVNVAILKADGATVATIDTTNANGEVALALLINSLTKEGSNYSVFVPGHGEHGALAVAATNDGGELTFAYKDAQKFDA
jgi:hypothetical protein